LLDLSVSVRLVLKVTHSLKLRTSTRVWPRLARLSTHLLTESQLTYHTEIQSWQDCCKNLWVVTPWLPWSLLAHRPCITKRRPGQPSDSDNVPSKLRTKPRSTRSFLFRNYDTCSYKLRKTFVSKSEQLGLWRNTSQCWSVMSFPTIRTFRLARSVLKRLSNNLSIFHSWIFRRTRWPRYSRSSTTRCLMMSWKYGILASLIISKRWKAKRRRRNLWFNKVL